MNHVFHYVGLVLLVIVPAICIGCSSLENKPGEGGRGRIEPDESDQVGGTGVDSKELIDMCDKMMRSIITCKEIANSPKPPTVALIDVENDTAFRINKNILLERLQLNLFRHASEKLMFVARERSTEILRERRAKREGRVDFDPAKLRDAMAGVDYFLVGKMTGISKRAASGLRADYILCTFQLIDAESGVVVWGDGYEFKKEALDTVMYR